MNKKKGIALEAFRVNSLRLCGEGRELVQLSNSLKIAGADVRCVKNGLRGKIVSNDSIGNRLNVIASTLDVLRTELNSYGMAIESISEKYRVTENKIANNSLGIGTIVGVAGSTAKTIGEVTGKNEQVVDSEDSVEKTEDEKQKFGGSVSWKQKNVEADGSVAGIDSHGEAEGSLGYAKYNGKISSGLSWKESTDENGNKIKKLNDITLISAAVVGSASVVHGSAKGNIGFLRGNISGDVGKIGAKGQAKIGLMEKGKIQPKICAEAEVSAVGAEGSAEADFGTENTNIHGAAEGKLGYAKASAGVETGKITYKTSTGDEKEGWGAGVNVGAEAYAAQGTVKGGISVLGIKIDASLTGKAGGGGASAGASLTTGGIHGSASVGALLGLGVDLDIDWSGFKWSW